MDNGLPMKILHTTLIISFAACAGAGARTTSQVRTQAAFDLQCPENEVTVVEIDYRATYGAQGCGRQTTYQYIKGEERVVRNGEVSDLQPSSAP
jgi:hypothetical protein